MPTSPVRIVNSARGIVLADSAEVARSFVARGQGLMGRASLPDGYALIIYPCTSIHTFFMRLPIDVLFMDKGHRVLGLRHAMPPNLPYAGVSPFRGRYVIELPSGVLAATGTQVGDVLELTPPV